MAAPAVEGWHTYSDGMMASAAYWIGSSARDIQIGKVAEAGSVGVLTVHKEISKMLADSGITATVMRAGEYKALGNPYEKLGDKAKAEIQGQLDQMYSLFIGHVADSRGLTVTEADSRLGQGRVFIGDRAVSAGLVDGISSFDATISRIQGEIDSRKSSSQYGANFGKGPLVKTALTQQQIAAMAEGALAAAQASPPEQDGAGHAAAAADVNPENPDGDVAAGAQAAPAAQAEDKPSDLVAFLQGQLA